MHDLTYLDRLRTTKGRQRVSDLTYLDRLRTTKGLQRVSDLTYLDRLRTTKGRQRVSDLTYLDRLRTTKGLQRVSDLTYLDRLRTTKGLQRVSDLTYLDRLRTTKGLQRVSDLAYLDRLRATKGLQWEEAERREGREAGRKETGRKGTGGKTTGVKERGVGETGWKEQGVGETGGKTTGVKERGVGETRAKEWEVGETGAKKTGGKGSGQNVMEGIERKSYSAAVIEGVRKRARVFLGDTIVRKTDRVLNKGDDVVVCLPGAKIEAITERVETIVGSGKGGSVLVHVGTNNVEREGTTAIVRKYRQLVRTLKQTRVEPVILSGILPVMGRRGHKYRNCRGMAINMLVQKLCREEEVEFVDLWGSFVGRADMYMKDGFHLSGKGAAVFADELSEVSNWKSVLSGVPQGSVLGPILFLIYINDLDDSITSNVLIFAKLFRKVNTDGDKQHLQNDLDRLVKWSEKWQMLFNFGKCQCLHTGHGNVDVNYKMGDTVLGITVKKRT